MTQAAAALVPMSVSDVVIHCCYDFLPSTIFSISNFLQSFVTLTTLARFYQEGMQLCFTSGWKGKSAVLEEGSGRGGV